MGVTYLSISSVLITMALGIHLMILFLLYVIRKDLRECRYGATKGSRMGVSVVALIGLLGLEVAILPAIAILMYMSI